MTKPYTEKQLVAALKRLEERWPDGYSLFSWSGTLCLINDDLVPAPNLSASGWDGNYEDAVVEDFPGIPNDGGDP